MNHEVAPAALYLKVFAALMGLTTITVSAAFIDFGFFSIVIAITIAVIKAVLVILFFMHLKDSSRLSQLFACAAIVWLLILFGLTMGDYDSSQLLEALKSIDYKGPVILHTWGLQKAAADHHHTSFKRFYEMLDTK